MKNQYPTIFSGDIQKQMFCKTSILKNFGNLTEKHLCTSFPLKFVKFLRTTSFTEYLQWLLLDILFSSSNNSETLSYICSYSLMIFF